MYGQLAFAGANMYMTMAQARTSARALRLQGRYAQQQAKVQARLFDLQAADATLRGEEQAKLIKQRSEQLIGSQRAQMAAMGIDVNEGTAAQLQSETAEMAAEDVLKAKNNAWREAWGYKFQATQAIFGGEMTNLGNQFAANNTIIAGGLESLETGIKAASDTNLFGEATSSARNWFSGISGGWQRGRGGTIVGGASYSSMGNIG